jgi:hypothetical protein
VVHAYNPGYSGGLRFEASLGKKLGRPYLKNKLSVVVDACYPSYLGGRGWKIVVQDQAGQLARPYLRNKLKAKGVGAQLKWCMLV